MKRIISTKVPLDDAISKVSSEAIYTPVTSLTYVLW